MQSFYIGNQEIKIINKGLWAFHIREPIFSTNVAIRDIILKKAIANKVRLLLTCPGGEETVEPKAWKKKAKKFKKAFLFKDDPMTFYQGYIAKEKSREEKEKQNVLRACGWL